MGHFARSQQPSAVKVRGRSSVVLRLSLSVRSASPSGWGRQTMVNESDWLALVDRLKQNLHTER
jgi:hypothetical protein